MYIHMLLATRQACYFFQKRIYCLTLKKFVQLQTDFFYVKKSLHILYIISVEQKTI